MKSSAAQIRFQVLTEQRNSFSLLSSECPICLNLFSACDHTEAQARERFEFELFEAQKKLFEDERSKK